MERATEEVNKTEDRQKESGVNEALDLLNRSARDKKEELKKVISNRYMDIRDEAAGVMRNRPWIVLSSIAASFLVIGFFIGNSRK